MTKRLDPKRGASRRGRRALQRFAERTGARAYAQAFSVLYKDHEHLKTLEDMPEDREWLRFPPLVCFVCLLLITALSWAGDAFGPGFDDNAVVGWLRWLLLVTSVSVTVTLVLLIILQVTAPGFQVLGAGVAFRRAKIEQANRNPQRRARLERQIAEAQDALKAARAVYDPRRTPRMPATEEEVVAHDRALAEQDILKRLQLELQAIKFYDKSWDEVERYDEQAVFELKQRLWRMARYGVVANICAVLMFSAWSQIAPHAFEGSPPSLPHFILYILNLMVRGALINAVDIPQFDAVADLSLSFFGSPLFFIAIVSFRLLESLYISSILFAYIRLYLERRAVNRARRQDGDRPKGDA